MAHARYKNLELDFERVKQQAEQVLYDSPTMTTRPPDLQFINRLFTRSD
ncbi:MAG: hypothetical protein Q8O37_07520 [Sulfuricellaceae bacterium]|nr:hypothetical protein [Sulfuricellaceae bacterium]